MSSSHLSKNVDFCRIFITRKRKLNVLSFSFLERLDFHSFVAFKITNRCRRNWPKVVFEAAIGVDRIGCSTRTPYYWTMLRIILVVWPSVWTQHCIIMGLGYGQLSNEALSLALWKSAVHANWVMQTMDFDTENRFTNVTATSSSWLVLESWSEFAVMLTRLQLLLYHEIQI